MKTVKLGVIPAAGEGKRMGYLSDILPKPLFPLFDKPIIHYVIENMISCGVEKVIVPIYHMKEKLADYLNRLKKELGIGITLVELPRLPKGIALTIASVKKYVDKPFITILGDDVTVTRSLAPLVDLFFETNAIAVEGVVEETNSDLLRSTCCVDVGPHSEISRIYEKPAFPVTKLRGCGVYVFHPDIFEFIARTPRSSARNEVEITDTIGIVARHGGAYACAIHGENINVNTPEDLLKAWLAIQKHQIEARR